MEAVVEFEKYIGSNASPNALTICEKLYFNTKTEAEEWVKLVSSLKNIKFTNFKVTKIINI